MLEGLKKEYKEKMEKVVTDLEKAFGTIRTGRASLSLVDSISVAAYGTTMPIIQVASLSTPDARTIAIQPFDAGQIGAVEKAIVASDVGITPNNDGKVIRLTIPPLTEDRRKELVKLAKKYTEEHRVNVRQIRHQLNDALKKLEKDSEISEDDLHKELDNVQKLTDDCIQKLDELLKNKEDEIMEV